MTALLHTGFQFFSFCDRGVLDGQGRQVTQAQVNIVHAGQAGPCGLEHDLLVIHGDQLRHGGRGARKGVFAFRRGPLAGAGGQAAPEYGWPGGVARACAPPVAPPCERRPAAESAQARSLCGGLAGVEPEEDAANTEANAQVDKELRTVRVQAHHFQNLFLFATRRGRRGVAAACE